MFFLDTLFRYLPQQMHNTAAILLPNVQLITMGKRATYVPGLNAFCTSLIHYSKMATSRVILINHDKSGFGFPKGHWIQWLVSWWCRRVTARSCHDLSSPSSQFMRGETRIHGQCEIVEHEVFNYRMEWGLSDYETTRFRSLHVKSHRKKYST